MECKVGGVDPSCAFGFYISGAGEWEELKEWMKGWGGCQVEWARADIGDWDGGAGGEVLDEEDEEDWEFV